MFTSPYLIKEWKGILKQEHLGIMTCFEAKHTKLSVQYFILSVCFAIMCLYYLLIVPCVGSWNGGMFCWCKFHSTYNYRCSWWGMDLDVIYDVYNCHLHLISFGDFWFRVFLCSDQTGSLCTFMMFLTWSVIFLDLQL